VIALIAVSVTVPVTASPASADIVPGTHICENFGATVSGYRAGHCVDLFFYRWSNGSERVLAVGQAFCQRASDGVIVQCAGIALRTRVYAFPFGLKPWVLAECGRNVNHNPPCPAGRYQYYGAEWSGRCQGSFAGVQTTVILPVSGTTQTSGELYTPDGRC
jgi:hypothetical protein